MSRIIYNIKQAFVQMWRNKGMSIASIFAITAMLLILGLFFVLTVNVNMFTESVKQDYNTMEIFLLDSTSETQAEDIMKEFEKIDGVGNVQYRTKEDAMKIMKSRWGENAYLLDSLGENPLPNSVLVEIKDFSVADEVYDKAESVDGAESVKYYKDTVDRLNKVTRVIRIAAIVIIIFLIIVSMVVVSNTIKLTVFARQREISIMRYVGATNWFIRFPFLLEGILIGLISAVISSAVCFFIYARVVASMGRQIMTILSFQLVPADYLVSNMLLIFMAIGIGIGSFGSIISMRRFLDV